MRLLGGETVNESAFYGGTWPATRSGRMLAWPAITLFRLTAFPAACAVVACGIAAWDAALTLRELVRDFNGEKNHEL